MEDNKKAAEGEDQVAKKVSKTVIFGKKKTQKAKKVNFVTDKENEKKTDVEEDIFIKNESQFLQKSKTLKISRKNSCDLELRSSKRFVTKQKTEIFKYDLNKKKEEEFSTELLNDFKTDCILFDNKQSFNGKLFIDPSFNVFFSGELANKPKYFNSNFYIFPLLSIASCEADNSYFGQSKFSKEITLKDSRKFYFKFPPNSFDKFNEIIEKFALPDKNENYFQYAYLNKKNFDKNNFGKEYINGWDIYDFEKEYERQGVDFKSSFRFRIFDNSDFKFCATYPKKFVVPLSIKDEELKECATFRTKERIPVLAYRYKNASCIWRSSQTKRGMYGKNDKDVHLLTKISEGGDKFYVYDARPYMNAFANKLKGAGYEKVSDYPNINMELIFCGIANIHVVRESFRKMQVNVSYSNNETNILNYLQDSQWYDIIIIILKSSFNIYNTIKNCCNLLIHCSDGWDRTSQLSATAQLLLDNYYRTLDGFICLIEKEWLSYGHQFRYRSGMYSPLDSPPNISSENQFSPIFIQWLDVIFQLMYQNYSKFQFNFELLHFLAEEMFTGNYGTFLFNNENEREKYEAKSKTVSIWTYVKLNESKFLNPIYDPENLRPLNINYKNIKLWNDYFCRFDSMPGYLEDYNKKINKCEGIINKDNKIIDELLKLVANKNSEEDLAGLSKECRTLIQKYKNGKQKETNTKNE